jgi:Signal transduction histidine kinase
MKSLYVRVLCITLYTLAVSALLGYYLTTVYYIEALKPQQDAKLVRIAENVRDYAQRHSDAMGDYLRHVADLGYQLYLYDGNGNDFYYGSPFGLADLPQSIKDSVLAGGSYGGIADYSNHPLALWKYDNRLSNTVGLPITDGEGRYALFIRPDTHAMYREIRIFIGLIGLVTALLCVPYFMLSTRYLVQPIAGLTEATRLIAQGHYRVRLPTNRKDEIGRLAEHFRSMAAQLERSDKAKQEFVANVSHEIQSPLHSIQGFADTLLAPGIADQDRLRYAGIIGREARRLAALARQLLLLSSLDYADGLDAKRSCLLQPQLRQSVQLLQWQLAEKEIALRMQAAPDIRISGDEVLLMQIWSNLLSNAVKHIPSGRTIELRAERGDGCCIVEISDTGDGIPEENLPYIYERFYRGDKARLREEGSTGLGLSIVHKIVALHGGSIEAKSAAGQGTSFRIVIPD